jgi:hypothetical protein
MVALSRLRPFLGSVLFLFQLFKMIRIAALQENQLFVFDPKALHHILVKVIFYILQSSWLHILIGSGSIYLWRTIGNYWVNYPCHSEPTMEYWHLTWRGNRLFFGPGLVGTLGIVCPALLHEHVLTLIKESSTESRERCWTLCFPLHTCAKWACSTVLYFR